MDPALREAANIQLRHWLLIFLGCVLMKKFGFADELLSYLQAAHVDWLAIIAGGGASVRGMWVRWRHKAEVITAAAAPGGTTVAEVKQEVKRSGVLATLGSDWLTVVMTLGIVGCIIVVAVKF